MKQGVEKLSYDDFVALLSSTTAESLNRPAYALSEFPGALLLMQPILTERACGIIGPAMDYVRGFIEDLTPELQNLGHGRSHRVAGLRAESAQGSANGRGDASLQAVLDRMAQGLTHLSYLS